MSDTALQAEARNGSETNRILIVDTNKSRFVDLMKALDERGVQVNHIDDRNELITFAKSYKPHVILINLFLNSSSTISAIRELKLAIAGVRIIVLTGHYSKTNIQESVKAGANDFILEPFDMNLMLERIKYQLQERAEYNPEELKQDSKNDDKVDLLNGFTLLYDCLRIISEIKEAHPAMHACLKKIAELSQASRVNIVLGDLETAKGCILASSDDAQLESLSVDIEKYPEVREVLLNGSIIYIKDITSNPLTKNIKAAVKSIDITSLLVFPIRHRQETIATLNIRIGKDGINVSDKHLKTFYMSALALSSKVAAKKLLKRIESPAS